MAVLDRACAFHHVAHRLTMVRGVIPCCVLNLDCLLRRRLSVSAIARSNRPGACIRIEDRLAAPHCARPGRSSESTNPPTAGSLPFVGVENRDQRHLGHVESLPQQIDADDDVEFTQTEVAYMIVA